MISVPLSLNLLEYLYELFWCVIESKDECLLLGTTGSVSSNIHFLLTGPRGDGLNVIGDNDLLLVQHLRVGEEDGDGENDKFGTGICMLGEKHCLPGTDDLVGDGEGLGDVRGDGNGPTPMVSGVIGSDPDLRELWLLWPGTLDLAAASLLSLYKHYKIWYDVKQ